MKPNLKAGIVKKLGYLFWRRYIESVDPLGRQLRLAIKCAISAVIAYIVGYLVDHNQEVWFVCPAIFITYCYSGLKISTRFKTQLGLGVSLALGNSLGGLFAHIFWLNLIFIFIVTMTVFYIKRFGMVIGLCGVLVLMMMILSNSFPATLQESLLRGGYSLVGVLIGMVVSNALWRYRPVRELDANVQLGFLQLNYYLRFILNDALRGNYHHRIHCELKKRVMQTMQYCRQLNQISNHADFSDIFQAQNNLLKYITALSDVLGYADKTIIVRQLKDRLHGLLITLPTENVSLLKFIPPVKAKKDEDRVLAGDAEQECIEIDYILNKIIVQLAALHHFS